MPMKTRSLSTALLLTLAACSSEQGGPTKVPATPGPCDIRTETSANVLLGPCTNVTTATGVTIELGPYDASMDVNVGAGFENERPINEDRCPGLISMFNEPEFTDQILDTGPQPCTTQEPNTGNCLNYQLYTVYRPSPWPSGPVPVLGWGNGTCVQPEGYGALLRYVASHGFFVIAPNSRQVTDGSALTRAIDFAEAVNADPGSPYYGHLDLSKVGLMGHSQGSQAAGFVSADSRVQALILYNGTESNAKPYLAVSGDMELYGYTALSLSTALAAADTGAFLYYHDPAGSPENQYRGHIMVMLEPERMIDATVAWWQMMLNDDAAARNMFVGTNCGLCNQSTDFEFAQKGL